LKQSPEAGHDDVRHSSRPDVLQLLGDSTVLSVAAVRTDYDGAPGDFGVVLELEAAEALFDERRVQVHFTLVDLDRLRVALDAVRERIGREVGRSGQ
jgi:hypothetical protein